MRALLAALVQVAPAGAEVRRNAVTPRTLPAEGVLILRDGALGPAEQDIGSVWHVRRRVSVDVVTPADPADPLREARFDHLRRALDLALLDRSLGGLCDWSQVIASEAQTLALEGAVPMKGATIPVELHYAVARPLA